MLKYFCRFFKSLEQWEKYQPSSFWLCSIGLYISFSTGFGALFPESPRESQVVIEQIRGGGREDYSFLGKRKKFDLDFHRQLGQYFPDWAGRMDYQKKQEKFFKSAMRKKREMIRVRMKEKPKFYTKQELDAMDYFQGKGIYAKYQDKREKYNIFDTRQSFLLKMHEDKLRNEFLNSLNSRNNKTI
jgi:hypothetical protein